MPVTISTSYIGNPDTEKSLRSAIEEVFKKRGEDWHVSIIGDQKKSMWRVTVEGPKNFEWQGDFDGIHRTVQVASAIEKSLPI